MLINKTNEDRKFILEEKFKNIEKLCGGDLLWQEQ